MKIQTIRCDICKRELFYSDSNNKVDDFNSIITLEKNSEIKGNKGRILGERHYCSEECFLMDIQEVVFGKPTDILEKLAKVKGYKLIKDEKVEDKN
jgi:hypothetical protein